MTITTLDDALDRLVIFEKAAWAALYPGESCDAVPRFFHTQEAFPYWTNRVGPWTNDDDGEDFDVLRVTILARLVLGHVTSGYQGENEERLADFIPYFLGYMADRNTLITNTDAGTSPNPLQYLIEARVERGTGYAAFMNTGLPVVQAGTEFTITLEFNDTAR